MCGIGGVVSNRPIRSERLRRMAGSIAHRGPDDHGTWSDEQAGIGFAHTRLAIVDLSPLGHQPMTSANGRYVLIFNGEIYNHQALRQELETIGGAPQWRGHSDTESLIEAIAHWGLERALQKSTGMFAIALFDRATGTLSLARDRFGEKPLYYGWIGGDFLFGSELKVLVEAATVKPEVSNRAVGEFANQGYIRAPHSIYRNVYKLEFGCILEAHVHGLAGKAHSEAPTAPFRSDGLSVSRYWDYADVVSSGLEHQITDRRDALEQLEAALSASVRGQAVADVPIGAFLSGGVDSSLTVAMYQRFCSTTPRTFTIGFEDSRFNEADDARRIANHLGTEHHELFLSGSDLRDCIRTLPTMYDEPFADSSQIPTHLVSALARRDVKVAISGDGGDELFGGYNRHILAATAWSRTRSWPVPVQKAVGGTAARIPAGVWNTMASLRAGRRLPDNFGVKVQQGLQLLGSAKGLPDFYRSFSSSMRSYHLLTPEVSSAWTAPAPMRQLSSNPAVNMMYWDAISYLPGDVLCKVDRASMATSLEVRVPMLDHHVAEVASRIPIGMKIHNGVGKSILRDLLHKMLPSELFQRPKAGFAVPLGSWLRNELRPWADDLLNPAKLRANGYFDVSAVTQLWNAHLAGTGDFGEPIWAVLMFQSWAAQWL